MRFLGFRVEHLRHVGWAAYRVESYVNWCGHGQEVISRGRPAWGLTRPGDADSRTTASVTDASGVLK